MNARFNGYFYSRENMKETVKKVEKANKDDFSQIVPMFVYPTNATAKNYYGDFDKSIKKSSVVIQRHAITSKKTKEEIPNACRWIDENYVLIGMSHFYKRDFFSALEAFEYVSKKYPNPEAKYTGMLWMIRTNNEIGSLSQSEPIIDQIRNAKDFPTDRSFQREYAAVVADYYIKRGDYAPAIKNLTKAIALTKHKKTRARYTFVLAQLYEKAGDKNHAAQYYGLVPKLHPQSYDMEFNARINRAKMFDVTAGDSKSIKKELTKMLRDDKNTEFRDQIYYVLADMEYREKNIPLALEYLDKSVRESTGNGTQKALSYLRRADIYFDRADYTAAEANYDSTMSFLPKEYPDYSLIAEKKKSLTSLVTNLKTIAVEDSVQRLARLTEAQRNIVIDKLIAQAAEDERLAEEAKQNEQNNLLLLNQNSTPTTNTVVPNTGAWYFYNPSTVSFGIADFNKKWGPRKLEDNWRRSQKDEVLANNMSENPENTENPTDSTTTGDPNNKTGGNKIPVVKNKKDRQYYLQAIPLTEEALGKSNSKIVESFYSIGSIYKEQLQNNEKSIQAFEELLRRYPENKYKLSSYYQLYRTFLSMNNLQKSDYYKNLILNGSPDSEYAMIIKNPESAKDIAESRNKVENFYNETFKLYSEGNYQQALANCRKADTLYGRSSLMPQFAFIKALSVGRTQDIDAFERALTQVVIKYPKAPVKVKAQEMLDQIKKQKTGVTTDSVKTDKPSFVFNENGEYYWITIVEQGKGDINKFKTTLSDMHSESFSMDELHISNVFLDATHQLVTVKSFDGKAKAMNYYNFMKDKPSAFASLVKGSYTTIVISAENYTLFYKEKNIEEYQQFFTQKFK
ncbi:MAG: tol-pal system protein YbgF [Bacteroidota bacterium]|nr:tol-pal system protein YbgF [Bacteroidota bacterium]